jgi:hypothetical protein
MRPASHARNTAGPASQKRGAHAARLAAAPVTLQGVIVNHNETLVSALPTNHNETLVSAAPVIR